jgi:proline iminopeptidase
MRTLYPEIKPNSSTMLTVDAPHEIYVEECGNPQGLPVLFVHGGPGAGCEPYHRRFFDPNIYRIVLFDQRGAGRSRPHAHLEGNNTAALVSDMEAIRESLGIDSWVLFGGSWGSTLSLVYAETHPDRVLAMVLRGIFLCRDEEIDWFYREGASRVFPDYWEDFLAPLSDGERADPVAAHYRRLVGNDELARMSSAKAWSIWEGRTSSLRPKQSVVDFFSDPHTALALARIECHYFVNHCFLEPSQILRDAQYLHGIPGTIVHGRYDMICPLENAWALSRAWPQAQLRVVADAGHSATEPGTVDALVQATDALPRALGPADGPLRDR